MILTTSRFPPTKEHSSQSSRRYAKKPPCDTLELESVSWSSYYHWSGRLWVNYCWCCQFVSLSFLLLFTQLLEYTLWWNASSTWPIFLQKSTRSRNGANFSHTSDQDEGFAALIYVFGQVGLVMWVHDLLSNIIMSSTLLAKRCSKLYKRPAVAAIYTLTKYL